MRDSGVEFLHYRLISEPRAAQRARHVARSVLDGWHVGGLADDVVTCVSELLANVYEHAAGSPAAELFLLWVPGAFLSAEVRDQDPRMPRRSPTAEPTVLPLALIDPPDDELDIMRLTETGRGLAVVEALCDRLWWQPDNSGGKVIRCHWRLKAASDIARNYSSSSSGTEGSDTDPLA